VEAISFGTSNYYQEPSPKAWQLAIGRFLPYKLAATLDWRFNTGDWSSIVNPNGMTSLGILAKREGSGRAASDDIRVVVLDGDGNSFGCDRGGRSTGGQDRARTHYHQLRTWDIPAFPRRGNTLVVRLLQKQGDGKVDLPIMQFNFPNPQPGQYPTWTAESWPVTRNDGNLTVTLTDFVTGLSKSDPTRAALENEEPVTRLTLGLVAKGQTNCLWKVRVVEVSDATSNRWNAVPWGSKFTSRQQGVTQTMNLSGNLWASESAWKLRVELVPTTGVSSDDNKRFVEFMAKPRTLPSKSETQRSQ